MVTPEEIARRNQEIAGIIAAARQNAELSISRVAQILSTSRRRYTAIERGEVPIGLVEAQVLCQALAILPGQLWPGVQGSEGSTQVVVHVPLGKTVQVVFQSGDV